MRRVRIVLWGFGAMGSGVARMLLNKKGVEITGVVDGWDKLWGVSIFERLQLKQEDYPEQPDVLIVENPAEVVSRENCDLVVLATDSFTAKAYSKICFCLERGVNVITTAEEMAWPWAQEPELSAEMDRLARQNKVSVLGTGVNPGFILDLLVLVLTGACEGVDWIKAARINDLSPFGKAVMEEQGVGIEVDEFNRLVAEDKMTGHVGFPESVGLIAAGLGVEIVDLKETRDAIVSTVERKADHFHVLPGKVAGVRQQVFASSKDTKDFIHLDHPQQVYPELEGTETGDYINIRSGEVEMKMRIKPETPGGIGTIAMCVNMIPLVINAEPGLLSLLDLPIPRAILGDMRLLMNANKEPRRLYKAGDMVTIEYVSIPAGERAPSVPEDTAACPLKVWLKGNLPEDAYTGDEVSIRTVIGREVKGRLTNLPVSYSHDYGEYVPELDCIRHQVKNILWEEA